MDIRNYQKGDENQIMYLFRLAFRKEMTAEYWRWRFMQNPDGPCMIKLMWDGEQLAGHYALSPVIMNVEKEKILTGLSVTSMIHPSYVGLGIFNELAEALYAEHHQNNHVMAVWGFPNVNSHYVFMHSLQWRDVSVLPMMSASVHQLKKAAPITLRPIRQFSAKHQQMAGELIKPSGIFTDRHPSYLNWRYLDCPVHSYAAYEIFTNDLQGFIVAKVIKSFNDPDSYELDIMEVFLPPSPRLLAATLNALIANFPAFTLTKLNCWIPLHHPLHGCFERIGFRNDLPLTYHGTRVMGEKMDAMLDPAKWYLSLGDSDVY